MTYPGTSVTEFFERFPDEEACLRHIFAVRLGDHSTCPRCGETGGWSRITGTKKYLHRCRHHISILEGTPFYRSNLSLMAWFYGLLLFSNSSTGMRSSFLRRQMGIGVKSAHRMANEIRAHLASFEPAGKVGGRGKIVHVDEALIRNVVNGQTRRPHIVMGMACDGKVISGILPDRRLPTISRVIAKRIRRGSEIVTDCHLAYSSLAAEGWKHTPINHARAFHNFAGMTNNPIEVYWSVLKRTLRLYQRIAPHNLWRFLAEIQFRYNRRNSLVSPFDELVGAFPRLTPGEREKLQRYFDWSPD